MNVPSLEAIYENEEPAEARRILLPLAEAGNGEAQFYLGHLADEPPRRADVALNWYRRSFESGFLPARHWLASFLYHGLGGDKNIPKALELFREGAFAKDHASQLALGSHLLADPTSRAEGMRWLELSAAQGNPSAVEILARVGAGDA